MKKVFLLPVCVLLLFLNAYSQKENKGYLRLSPTINFPKDMDPTPSGMVNAGLKFSNYAALGVGFGAIKFKDIKTIIPIGGELCFTNFSSKKLSPMGSIGVYYPLYNDTKTTSTSGSMISTAGKGVIQLTGALGEKLPGPKKVDFGIMVGFSQLNLDNKITTTTYGPNRPSTKTETTIRSEFKMITVSLCIIFN